MFGADLLVAPKLTEPSEDQTTRQEQSVSFILPSGELWYET